MWLLKVATIKNCCVAAGLAWVFLKIGELIRTPGLMGMNRT